MKFYEKIGVVTMTGSVVLLMFLSALSTPSYFYHCSINEYEKGVFSVMMNCLTLGNLQLKYIIILCVIMFCIGFFLV